MELLIVAITLIYLVVTFAVICIAVADRCYETSKGKFVIGTILLIFSLWCIQDGYKEEVLQEYEGSVKKVLVSASPSSTKTEGSFLLFVGSLSETRYYLLREEVEDLLYKDFEVKAKDTYLREDSTLKGKGLYVESYDCKDIKKSYVLLVWVIAEKEKQPCNLRRKEIRVPLGSVIKELKV